MIHWIQHLLNKRCNNWVSPVSALEIIPLILKLIFVCDELCLFSVKLSYVCIIVAILTQLFEQYFVKIKPSRKFGIYLACGDITVLDFKLMWNFLIFSWCSAITTCSRRFSRVFRFPAKKGISVGLNFLYLLPAGFLVDDWSGHPGLKFQILFKWGQ